MSQLDTKEVPIETTPLMGYQEMEPPTGRRSRKCCIFLTVTFILLLIGGTCLILLLPHGNKYDYDKLYYTSSRTKTILLWDSLDGDENWFLPNDQLDKENMDYELHCQYTNCLVTKYRGYEPGGVDNFDAILYGSAESYYEETILPRTLHRIFVSSKKYPTKNKAEDDIYNLTVTYKSRARTMFQSKHLLVNNFMPPPQHLEQNSTGAGNETAPKILILRWGNCSDEHWSERPEALKVLEQYADVDIVCEKVENIDLTKYHFLILHVESFCLDNVRKHFYKAMQNSVISVFWTINNFQYIPHGSLLAQDFTIPPNQLGLVLKSIYNKKVDFKTLLRRAQLAYFRPTIPLFCEVCAVLNTGEERVNKRITGDLWRRTHCNSNGQ